MAAEAAQRGDWAWSQPPSSDSGRPTWVGDHIPVGRPDDPTVIDCDRCTMRGIGCADCVVTVLLGGPPYGVELDEVEERALGVLADAGLVPPLRMAEPAPESSECRPDGTGSGCNGRDWCDTCGYRG